ncbi:MAG: YjbQ family protein [Chloroflexi bacterium]|nr:MAG: YjbQ family protein [Chloroflexota bacterium]
MVISKSIELRTRGRCDIQDITSQVNQEVAQSGVKNGIVTVFVPGSTGGVTTIEFESGLISDLQQMFERVIPTNIAYKHDLRWGDGNGYAHVRASLLGPSLTVPLVDGRLTLGTWQQIVFVDFDNRPRSRRLIVQIVGE